MIENSSDECNHCWHYEADPLGGMPAKYVCCHCGAEKQEEYMVARPRVLTYKLERKPDCSRRKRVVIR